MKPKTLSFLVCFTTCLGLTVWAGVEYLARDPLGGPNFNTLVITGYSALSLLGLCLLASPLGIVASWVGLRLSVPMLVAFRRSFGLAAAWMAAMHLLSVITQYLHGRWDTLLENVFLSSGFVAFLLLLILSLTSFPAISRLLRIRLWGELHKLIYAIAILTVFHLNLAAFAPRWVTLLSIGLLPLLLVLRLLPRRARVST